MSGGIDKATVERFIDFVECALDPMGAASLISTLAAHAEKLERENERLRNHGREAAAIVDAVRAQAGAIAAEVRERIVEMVSQRYGYSASTYKAVMAIPLPTDAQAALDRAWNDAIDACAERMDMGLSYNAGNRCRALKRQPGKGEK